MQCELLINSNIVFTFLRKSTTRFADWRIIWTHSHTICLKFLPIELKAWYTVTTLNDSDTTLAIFPWQPTKSHNTFQISSTYLMYNLWIYRALECLWAIGWRLATRPLGCGTVGITWCLCNCHSLTHSLTSWPSSVRVGDSRWPLQYLPSPLCSVLCHLL